MTSALISQPVLSAKPAANCNVYLSGLLTELRQTVDAIPVVPGAAVPVSHRSIMELRGVVSELIGAVRNELKWQAAL